MCHNSSPSSLLLSPLLYFSFSLDFSSYSNSDIRCILKFLSNLSLLCISSIISHTSLSSIFIVSKFVAYLLLHELGSVFGASILFFSKPVINTYLYLIIRKPSQSLVYTNLLHLVLDSKTQRHK